MMDQKTLILKELLPEHSRGLLPMPAVGAGVCATSACKALAAEFMHTTRTLLWDITRVMPYKQTFGDLVVPNSSKISGEPCANLTHCEPDSWTFLFYKFESNNL